MGLEDELDFNQNDTLDNFGDGNSGLVKTENGEGGESAKPFPERNGASTQRETPVQTDPHRVFIKNLSFDTTMKGLKQHLVEKCGNCFVDIHKKPTSGKSAGVATEWNKIEEILMENRVDLV